MAAHRPSVAPAVSTPDYAARRKSASPAVSTRSGSQASNRAKGQIHLQQWPGTCPRCVLHGNIRVGPSRTAVPRSRDRASPRRHGVLRPHSIHAHSSDRGVCGAGTTVKEIARAEARRSLITTTVREESQVTPQGRYLAFPPFVLESQYNALCSLLRLVFSFFFSRGQERNLNPIIQIPASTKDHPKSSRAIKIIQNPGEQ